MTEWIDVGVLMHAHGVTGEARLRLDPAVPIEVGSEISLQPRQPAASSFILRVKTLRSHGDDYLVRFDALGSRESLQPLHGARLRWPRAALPAAPVGEFYLWELLGASVEDEAAGLLGRVDHLSDNGAQPLLAVQAPGDLPGRQRLVPLVAPFIGRFDRDLHVLHLRLPAGLWEDA